jgi:preprotein translocase subunit SecY
VIPVPFLDVEALKGYMADAANEGLFAQFNMFSGGAFAHATLFAMSVQPYINSSIIMQLLTVGLPVLERLSKEGEEGHKKIAAITRYVTVIIGVMQGVGFYWILKNQHHGARYIVPFRTGWESWFAAVVIVAAFTAGTAMMMWLGEQVNKKGIGNGISILLFAGIVSRMPDMIGKLWVSITSAIENPESLSGNFIFVPLFVVMFLGLIWVIVFMNDAERRIPIQYAKRLVGRKMYGGQNSHLPIKVGLTGVMPIIFASTILMLPVTVYQLTHAKTIEQAEPGLWKTILTALSPNGWLYAGLYFLLIIMFAYFYVSIQYNPIEIANNLKQSNGTVPGIRPGKPTSDFITKVLSKVTLIGALFLAFIALLPMAFGGISSLSYLSFGGTSIIILVGVALETVKQMEAQMMQRHYKGFLD